MSFSLEFKWKGIEELKRVLNRAPHQLKTLIHKKMDEKSREIVFFAKHFVPVRTGYLQSTINYRSIGLLQFSIEAYADYAGFVEYGTSKQRAQPYLRPSFDLVTSTLKYELTQEINNYFMRQLRTVG